MCEVKDQWSNVKKQGARGKRLLEVRVDSAHYLIRNIKGG
jgi:hypothetical protein